MKRIVVPGGIAVGLVVLFAWAWPDLVFAPLGRNPTPISPRFSSRSPMPEHGEASNYPQQPGILKLKAETESRQVPDVASPEQATSASVARVRKVLRIVEQRNTKILRTIDTPKTLGVVAVVSKPAEEQMRKIFSAIALEKSRFASDSAEHKTLSTEIEKLLKEYGNFEATTKLVHARMSKAGGERLFFEYAQAGEVDVEFNEEGDVSRINSKGGAMTRTSRYEYLFGLSIQESEKQQ